MRVCEGSSTWRKMAPPWLIKTCVQLFSTCFVFCLVGEGGGIRLHRDHAYVEHKPRNATRAGHGHSTQSQHTVSARAHSPSAPLWPPCCGATSSPFCCSEDANRPQDRIASINQHPMSIVTAPSQHRHSTVTVTAAAQPQHSHVIRFQASISTH